MRLNPANWSCVSLVSTCRSLMRLQSMGSKFISYLMPILMKTKSSRSRPKSWRWERDTELMSAFTPSDTSVYWFSDRYHSLPIHLCFPSQILPQYLYFLYLLLLTLFCIGDPLTLIFLSQASIPFAVIGSNQLIEVKGKKIRGRLYPWGVVEVENPEHNDFLKLRTMLVWVCKDCLINMIFGRKGFQKNWHYFFQI